MPQYQFLHHASTTSIVNTSFSKYKSPQDTHEAGTNAAAVDASFSMYDYKAT
ncbi:predicted protein [Botrytis cinerea T4]|uniref:Uncharacterized protein n=1 Tax=Botryotinia fuckeliana (strain T4) TaxID=999810 RepID=G2YQU7_BOTF4|nr:predicted protein [Botrytis cinerea T4]